MSCCVPLYSPVQSPSFWTGTWHSLCCRLLGSTVTGWTEEREKIDPSTLNNETVFFFRWNDNNEYIVMRAVIVAALEICVCPEKVGSTWPDEDMWCHLIEFHVNDFPGLLVCDKSCSWCVNPPTPSKLSLCGYITLQILKYHLVAALSITNCCWCSHQSSEIYHYIYILYIVLRAYSRPSC